MFQNRKKKILMNEYFAITKINKNYLPRYEKLEIKKKYNNKKNL